MFLPVDPSSGLPIYRQIVDQVRRMIVAGGLAVGERLPSVRELSATLQINPLTVAKAYGELELAGLVEMRRGLGVFVAERGAAAEEDEEAGVRALGGPAERLVLEAVQAGVGERALARLLAETWKRVRGARGGSKK
jgi:GntR family transcriptional regulator